MYVIRVDSYEGKMMSFSAVILTNLAFVLVTGVVRAFWSRTEKLPLGLLLGLGFGMLAQMAVLFLAGMLPLYYQGVFSIAGATTLAGYLVLIPAMVWISPMTGEMRDRGPRWEVSWWAFTVALQTVYVLGFVRHIWPNMLTWIQASR